MNISDETQQFAAKLVIHARDMRASGNYKDALLAMKRAAHLGNSEAMWWLWHAYTYSGLTVLISATKADKWQNRALAAGHVVALAQRWAKEEADRQRQGYYDSPLAQKQAGKPVACSQLLRQIINGNNCYAFAVCLKSLQLRDTPGLSSMIYGPECKALFPVISRINNNQQQQAMTSSNAGLSRSKDSCNINNTASSSWDLRLEALRNGRISCLLQEASGSHYAMVAMYELGKYYQVKHPQQQNIAIRFFLQAAMLGCPLSQWQMCLYAAEGLIPEEGVPAAASSSMMLTPYECLVRAAKQGLTEAQIALGTIYWSGRKVMLSPGVGELSKFCDDTSLQGRQIQSNLQGSSSTRTRALLSNNGAQLRSKTDKGEAHNNATQHGSVDPKTDKGEARGNATHLGSVDPKTDSRDTCNNGTQLSSKTDKGGSGSGLPTTDESATDLNERNWRKAAKLLIRLVMSSSVDKEESQHVSKPVHLHRNTLVKRLRIDVELAQMTPSLAATHEQRRSIIKAKNEALRELFVYGEATTHSRPIFNGLPDPLLCYARDIFQLTTFAVHQAIICWTWVANQLFHQKRTPYAFPRDLVNMISTLLWDSRKDPHSWTRASKSTSTKAAFKSSKSGHGIGGGGGTGGNMSGMVRHYVPTPKKLRQN